MGFRIFLWFMAFGLIVGLAPLASAYAERNPPKPKKEQHYWPPRLAKPYPDLVLFNAAGQKMRLSRFKGRIILIELIAMRSPASQAFAGGQKKGGFSNVRPQSGLASLPDYFSQYARIPITDPRVIVVHLILSNMQLKPPTPDDLQSWAWHFDLDRYPNHMVLGAPPDILNEQVLSMVPGFQLVDQNFVLIGDSSGQKPRHNLYAQLLPAIPKLIAQGGRAPK